MTSSSPPCLRVQNLGWYQPSRTNGSPRDTRFGFYHSLGSADPPSSARLCANHRGTRRAPGRAGRRWKSRLQAGVPPVPDESQQFGIRTSTALPLRPAQLSQGERAARRCRVSVCVHGPTASPDPPPASPRLAGSSGTITLRCKDLKVLQLEIPGMEECLNIASSIEVSSRAAREPGPSRAGVQRVGRRKRPPAVFALGLSLTWVNTQLPARVGTGCPRGWWCQHLPAQPSLAAGTWPGAGNGDGVCRGCPGDTVGTFPAISVLPTRDQLHLCSRSRPSPRWTP